MERLNDYEPPVRMDAKHDALDTMWAFLQMGGQKADILALKEYCGIFRRMMIQKTAGQRNEKSDISFAQLDTICYPDCINPAPLRVLTREQKDRINARARERRAAHKAAGLCAMCGRQRDNPRWLLCVYCRARRRLAAKKSRQNRGT